MIPQVYLVTLPPEYHNAMRVFRWVNLDWLELMLPVQCIGTFKTRLLIEGVLPALLMFFLLGLSFWGTISDWRTAKVAQGSNPRLLPFPLYPSPWALPYSDPLCAPRGDRLTPPSLASLSCRSNHSCAPTAHQLSLAEGEPPAFT